MIRTIDFNDLTAGETVTTQYDAQNVQISALANAPGVDQAMVFDSANPTGGDEDLRTDDLEKVLIISEDGDATDPDDNSTGGTVEFSFTYLSTVKSLTFIDLEEPARMYFYAADGSLIEEQYVPPNGDNGVTQVSIFVENVDRLVVEMTESGALDNLVFDDSLPETPVGDGIVSGDEDGNIIDLAYTGDPEGDRIDAGDALLPGEAPDDDIVDARGGDDSVTALDGNDDIYAGSGDDTVLGGAGDDLIFGDRTLAGGEGARESFNWSELGAADGAAVSSFTQDTGSTNVTFTNLGSTAKTSTTFSSDQQNTSSIDGGAETVDANSSLESETRAEGQSATYELSFDSAVRDVDFNINDIDGDSLITIQAFDADGNPVEVTLTGGSGLTLSDTDAVPGNDTADSDGGYADAFGDVYSLKVDIAGPVSRVVISHVQNGPGGTNPNITDVFFTTAGSGVIAAGNDSLLGEEGDDTIFGEGGNDTIIGGAGADSLSGGDDADLFVGGDVGDVVDGGTGGDDRDTLDLSDSGPLRVAEETLDADGDSFSGTIEFLNADGSVRGTMTFAEIEEKMLPANLPPVATDDTATTDEDTTITIPVLANDTDPDLDPLTVTAASSDFGTVVINGDGTLDFTPNPDFFGEAVINYTITDGNGGFDDAVVTVTVNDVVDANAPVAVDDTAVTDEDTAVTIPVLANDSDPDGDPLTVIAATSADGDVVINADGTLTFTPNPDFNGDAVIDYTITDGRGGFDDSIVTVTVNPVQDPPVALDDVASTEEDTTVTISVLANDSDPDGDPLTITDATSADGAVTINGDGTIDFTPAAGFNGDAVINYTITDGNGGFDDAVVSVSVGEVNDAPVAADDVAETPEDTAITIPVLANDSDPDGDPLTITAASSPDGEVVINDDGTVTFTPNPDFNGPTTISYTISDGNGGEDTATVDLTVTPVNDPPVAEDDVAETDQATAVTVPVLLNDSDPEGDPLEIIAASSPDGDVVINDDGTLTFTPAPDFTGEATVNYSIGDGNGGTDPAIVTVTVLPVNTAPVAVDDTATTVEDTAVIIPVLANDTDPDLDPLTVTAATSDQGDVVINDDGTVTFTPNPDFTGEAVINYTISDGNGGSDDAVVTVTVTVTDGIVQFPPVATDDTAETDEETPVTIDVLLNDSDPDGDPLTVTEALSDDGTVVINGDGTLTFTPNEDFFGEAVIDYTITDGRGGFDDSRVFVTVNNVNDAPVAADDCVSTPEDTPVTIPVLANDTDADGDPLTVTSATSPDGDVVINADGTLTFTPATDFTGDAEITYTIEDGNGGTDTGIAKVSVGEVSDPPVAVDDVAETDEDTAVTIAVLANDSDPDGDPLTVTEATSPDGAVVINDDGTLTFTPDRDFNGPTTISYTIIDGNGGEATATVDVTVNPVNDGPLAEDDTADTNQGTAVIIAVLDNDSDVEGDPLTVIQAISPNGDVVINPDGTLTFTPAPDFTGEAVINYTVDDGNGATDPAVVFVTVRDGIVSGTDGDDVIDVDYTGDPEGDMVDNMDEFLPGEGPNDDIIEAGDGNDTVLAGDGNDDVSGGTGDDSIDGGVGDDSIAGDEGNDVLDGGMADGTVPGGDDTLLGGVGDDTIIGRDGSDVVEGGDGADSIDTGNGDVLPDLGYPGLFPGDPDPENDRDLVDGGAGNDTIRTGDDRDTITGGDGDDVINAGIDDDIVEGNDGDDRIVGGEGNDDILGGAGNDTIYAGNDPDEIPDGTDIEDDGSNPFGPDLRPDNGRDTVDGGDGDDVIFGADDDDVLLGGSGNDYIDGEIDDDIIDGGTGNDTLIGGQGNDSIDGGRGTDTIEGGTGNDTLRGNREDDTIHGGDGDDVIDGGADDDILSGDAGNDSLQGGTGNDLLDGGTGDDSLDAGQGDDTVEGGAGNDTISGNVGDDSLSGGDGDDVITGGQGDDLFDGGAGSDTMTGGADRDNFINVNAGDIVDGSETGDDFDCLDLTGSAPEGGSLNILPDPADPDNPENGIVQYRNADGSDAGQLVFSNIEKVIPCFTPGTMIATPRGERRVEDLEVGDRVITRDNGMQVIRWIGKRDMPGEELAAKEHLRPVLIRQGALGNGLPERDMMVSPQHRVLIANDKTALYFEEREVLVAAKHLTDMDGIDVVEVSSTTYIHIMFDRHEVVLSDGTWTESFQPGDMSLAGVGDASREEILELFPELATREGVDAYASARKALKKHEAKLITR
ncbi:cadherin-like domain-containing protein [Sulfitobacter sp. HNIBRBA3233]|uniref:Ig-like domain-containing protein n=1 Tax=Sulfitobacter marinivivus TaxID=3158558 RepID=UPI0032DEA429